MTEEEILTEETIEPVVEADATGTGEEGVTVNVTITQPETAAATASEALSDTEEIIAEAIPAAAAYTVTSPDVLAVAESDPDDPVMVDVITAVLGEYRRQTYTVEQYDASGELIATSTEYVPGLAGLDWAWITGAILFGIVLSAGFKMLGGLIRS